MAGHGTKFARKQEDAIAALLSQRSVADAARAAGIGERTLVRWMKLPEFDAEYREARRAAFGQSVGRLQQAASAAVTTLLKGGREHSGFHQGEMRRQRVEAHVEGH